MNVAELDKELNDLIFSGKALDAFEKFYAEDVVMQENTEPPFKGKALNRQREIDFFNTIETFHGGKLLSSAVNGDVSFSEQEYDFTPKGGKRTVLTQVAVRKWKNGQIVHERFYYHK